MAFLTRAGQIWRTIAPPITRIRARLTTPLWRRLWRVLTIASLLILGIGLYFTWRRFPAGALQIRPQFILLAVAIYILSYCVHLAAWHTLATLFFGRLPFRSNAEGVASSALLKYLPTIAWYIANRAHFYHQRNIPRKNVVAAAMTELGMMMASAGILYTIYWSDRASIWLGLLSSIAIVLLLVILLNRLSFVRRWAPDWLRGYLPAQRDEERTRYGWFVPLGLYSSTWLLGVCFLWAILNTFVPLQASDLIPLFNIWLLAGLAGYIVTTTLGAFGVARELTITFLLAQMWPLPVAIATSIVVRILLNVGELGCSAVILGWLYLIRKRAARE